MCVLAELLVSEAFYFRSVLAWKDILTFTPRYVRYEVQKRFSAFYLLALLASGGSSILAWGLSEMKGISGLNGWQWIFSIEGAITCVLGVLGFLLIVDFPDKATKPNFVTKRSFLTQEEAAIVMNRIQRDRGDAVVDKLTIPLILKHLKDWKIWEVRVPLDLNRDKPPFPLSPTLVTPKTCSY